MAELPTGTVTFLFTDIEGSTARWESQPELMRAALARHDALLRAAIQEHGGAVVKTMGDAFHAAFARAPDAVLAALDAQCRLLAGPWDEPGPPRVRMGLHSGVSEERGGDYYGPALNRAARLMSAGHGGQVLLSQATYELVRDTLPAGIELTDLGDHRLKDLIRPERIYQIVAPGLPSDFPPLRTLGSRPHNLPIQPTPLIGRERELLAVSDLLVREGARLVTLTGPGGIGKTRLGLQVAAHLVERYDDGAYLVELAPISDSSLVASTIAQALAVAVAADRPVLDILVQRLRDRRLLLVLDNFEQVLAAVTVVDELIRRCPTISILVTSRAPLQLRGEHEYPVPPLASPDTGRAVVSATLSQYEAVALFIERATAIRPDFAITNANAPAVAEICARLDGLPLAIELAAARIRLLPPEALLARLGHSLDLLTGGRRDLPPRQRTLRSAIAWSHDLLDAPAQRLFWRLGVFVGGFTLDGVESVCDVDGGPHLNVLDGVGLLVDSSLVRAREAPDGEPRFSMLETIREYAVEQLEASGEAGPIRRRHRDYFQVFAERVAAQLRGPRDAKLFDQLEAEHGNLRAALDWCEAETDGIDAAVPIVEGLAWFWVLRNHLREAIRRVERLIAADSRSAHTRATLLCVAGYLAYFRGDHEGAVRWLEPSLTLWRTLDDRRGLATALLHLAPALWALGDRAQAMALHEESVDLVRRAAPGLPHNAVLATYAEPPFQSLARFVAEQGDLDRAAQLRDEALAFSRAHGDSHGVANVLRTKALHACGRGDVDAAASLLAESLRLFHELADVPCSWNQLILVAYVATKAGRFTRATRLLGAADVQQGASGMAPLVIARAVHEDTIAAARTALGETVFSAAWAEGRSMMLDQAVAYALEPPVPA